MPERRHRGGRHRLGIVVSAAVLCGWSGWVAGFQRSTAPARVTWGFSLAAVVLLDLLLWQGRHHRRPGLHLEASARPRPRWRRGARQTWVGVAPWLGLALVVLAWSLLGLDTDARHAHLTISALSGAFRLLKAALLLVWMATGIGYGIARVRMPAPRSRSRLEALAMLPGTVQTGHVPLTGLLLPSNRALGVGFWLAVLAVGVIFEIAARKTRGRIADAEELLVFITTPPAANALLVSAWTYAGYHLFAH